MQKKNVLKSFEELYGIRNNFPQESTHTKDTTKTTSSKLNEITTPYQEVEFVKLVRRIINSLKSKDLYDLNKLLPTFKDGGVLLIEQYSMFLIELGIDPDKTFKVLINYINYKNSLNYGAKFKDAAKLLASLIFANEVFKKLE